MEDKKEKQKRIAKRLSDLWRDAVRFDTLNDALKKQILKLEEAQNNANT